MILDDLIYKLQQLQEQGFGYSQVEIVQQPTYPLKSSISGLATSLEIRTEDEEYVIEQEVEESDVVYIFAGTASEYGPSYRHIGY